VQFAVGHAAEFRDGLTILAPVIERAREVHVKPLSEGLICQQLSGLDSAKALNCVSHLLSH
jgi:hypothetical protein